MTGTAHNADFEALLEYVKHSRGFDFTGYKRSSLMRRVTKRMQTVNVGSYSDYLDYLEVHPDEFHHLFNTLLINVTSFFRDRPTWAYLSSEIIPQILARKEIDEPIRVWSAGCASGEEAYTIAMIIARIIGVEAFIKRVKIYATDVDEEALSQARQAIYRKQDLESVLPEELQQFFEPLDECYSFRKELRRAVIFGRHDLTQAAPISKIDLLVCRNTLMYFNAETQSRILARFHFALRDGGYLFLGKAEMLLTHADTFTPVQIKCRIFTKVPRLSFRDRLLVVAQTGNEEAVNHPSNQVRLREAAFDSSPIARAVLDAEGQLTLTNERARALFNLSPRDVGRPIQDLELSYRPVELRSCIEQAYLERRIVYLRDVEWQPPKAT
ncbi:MAG: CheR family methyltransferase [Leptolyngbyaceae cyanobacterium bins.349]|nr:CheR family methyltransferase [Leptolyngbyaceae cyanobacterium bins.349]